MSTIVTVEATQGGAAFRLRIGVWSDEYRLDRLPSWLRFYRVMRDRKEGAYRAAYEPTVLALEAFARGLDNAEKTGSNPG